MMRNPTQDPPVRILSPIPGELLPEAAILWWRRFGLRRIGRGAPVVRPENGAVAVDAQNRLRGVMGLRNGSGGFLHQPPRRARLLFRAAPCTSDLVIDGLLAVECRCGIGTALLDEGMRRARQERRPGLRVEVQARNRAALAFYHRHGFAEVARGRYGWPWSGMVIVMRRPV